MGRREKRLRRIDKLRVKERRLEGAVRLGAKDLTQDLLQTQKHIEALRQAIAKKPPPFTLDERHPIKDHPSGTLNRGLGAVRRILAVASGLYGDECLDAIGDAYHELDLLIRRDARAKQLSRFVEEACGLLEWTHVKSAGDRAMHFREERSTRRRHARLKRKTSAVRPYRGRSMKMRWLHRPGPTYRTLYLLDATKPCRCWLCKNSNLFNTKNGKLLFPVGDPLR